MSEDEVSSCVFGDCCWCTMGQGHNRKSGRFLVLCFHFLVERIGRGHDFCFFLDSGLCRAFPPSCLGKGGRVNLDRSKKLTHVP